MNDPYHCGECGSAFDCDFALLHNNNNDDDDDSNKQENHRLPVSCRFCPFAVCYHPCFQEKFDAWLQNLHTNSKTKSVAIPCPACQNEHGFDAFQPNVSPFACRLLQEQQVAGAKMTKSSPTENVVTTNTTTNESAITTTTLSTPAKRKQATAAVVVTPSGDNASISAGVIEAKESSALQIPNATNNINSAVNKQSQKGEAAVTLKRVLMEANEEVLSNDKQDQDHHQPPPAPAAAAAAAAAAAVPRSDTQDKEEQEPVKKKRKKRSSKKQADDDSAALYIMTPQEQTTLKETVFSLWLGNFESWLINVDGVSESNGRSVLRQVKKLVQGDGISYKHWPDSVMFYKGIHVNLSMNFDTMLEEAKMQEQQYGRDKGNGWLMRHPI